MTKVTQLEKSRTGIQTQVSLAPHYPSSLSFLVSEKLETLALEGREGRKEGRGHTPLHGSAPHQGASAFSSMIDPGEDAREGGAEEVAAEPATAEDN